MLSAKALKRMNAYVAKLDASVGATASKLAPTNKGVTASSLKTVIAQLNTDALNIQKIYAGLKKVLSNRSAYLKASKNDAMAKILSDIAVVATKIDLVKAVAESEMEEEIDTDNLEADDILNDLQEETGVSMGEEPEFDDEEVAVEGEGEGEGEFPTEDAEGEEPEFDEDEVAVEGEDMNSDEGEEDFDLSGIFPEEEIEEAPVAPTASKKAAAKKATAKVITKTTSGTSPLFNFVG